MAQQNSKKKKNSSSHNQIVNPTSDRPDDYFLYFNKGGSNHGNYTTSTLHDWQHSQKKTFNSRQDHKGPHVHQRQTSFQQDEKEKRNVQFKKDHVMAHNVDFSKGHSATSQSSALSWSEIPHAHQRQISFQQGEKEKRNFQFKKDHVMAHNVDFSKGHFTRSQSSAPSQAEIKMKPNAKTRKKKRKNGKDPYNIIKSPAESKGMNMPSFSNIITGQTMHKLNSNNVPTNYRKEKTTYQSKADTSCFKILPPKKTYKNHKGRTKKCKKNEITNLLSFTRKQTQVETPCGYFSPDKSNIIKTSSTLSVSSSSSKLSLGDAVDTSDDTDSDDGDDDSDGGDDDDDDSGDNDNFDSDDNDNFDSDDSKVSSEDDISSSHSLAASALSECSQTSLNCISNSTENKTYIAVYWDIENCQVPSGKSALDIVRKIRNQFYNGHTEAEFVITCDITGLNKKNLNELNESQVSVVHVNSESKNAADFKMRTFLRRFADYFNTPNSVIVFISGDSDFTSDLHELRYRHHTHIILIHNNMAKKSFCIVANEAILYDDFILDLPNNNLEIDQSATLIIGNIPQNIDKKVKKALNTILNNINGRVTKIEDSSAEIYFPDLKWAKKGAKRLEGCNICGNSVSLLHIKQSETAKHQASDLNSTKKKAKVKKSQSCPEDNVDANKSFKDCFSNKNASKQDGIKLTSQPMDANEKLPEKKLTLESPEYSGKDAKKQCTLNPQANIPSVREAFLVISVWEKFDDKHYWNAYLSQHWNYEFSIIEVFPEKKLLVVKFKSLNAAKKAKKIINNLKKKTNIAPEVTELYLADEADEKLSNIRTSDFLEISKVKKENIANCSKLMGTKMSSSIKMLNKKILSLQEMINSQQMSSSNEMGSKSQNMALAKVLGQLHEQKNVYEHFSSKIMEEVDSTVFLTKEEQENKIKELLSRFGRECCFLKMSLPVYAKKKDIIDLVQRNQVSVVLAETGSGKSTQIAQYLWQAGLAGKKLIICVQHNSSATVAIAHLASDQLGTACGKIIGYQVDGASKKSEESQIMYMTDFALMKEYICNTNFENCSCLIISEVQERSIYTDILLGLIKNVLPFRPDLKVVIISSTLNSSVFLSYFNLKNDAVINISGRLFPIEDIWSENTVPAIWDYLEETVKCAYKIHQEEELGNILAFLPTPADTEEAVDMLEKCMKENLQKHIKAVAFPLHENQSILEQKKILSQNMDGVRKIVFATNFADYIEATLFIPNIKFIIDCGMVQERYFEYGSKRDVLKLSFATQCSSEQHKIHACRNHLGKCYHLYSKKNYNDMPKCKIPDILKINITHPMLTLMSLGMNIFDFDYIDTPSIKTLSSVIEDLQQLGAVTDGTLTTLGKKMAKLALEPKLSKLLIMSFEEEIPYEGVVIASGASLAGELFYRKYKDKSDLNKACIFELNGDFSLLISIFKEWLLVPNSGKDYWCVVNGINAKALRAIHMNVKQLSVILSEELNLSFCQKFKNEEIYQKKIQQLIFECFFENLCIFSGHPSSGYMSLSSGQLFLHPSSSLYHLRSSVPQFIVYYSQLKTSHFYLLYVTTIDEEVIQHCVQTGKVKVDLTSLKKLVLRVKCISPVGETILLRDIIGKNDEKIFALKGEIKRQIKGGCFEINVNVDVGTIKIYTNSKYEALIEEHISKVISKSQENLIVEEMAVQNSTFLKIVFGSGFQVYEVILPGEYKSFNLQSLSEDLPIKSLMLVLETFGKIFKYREINTNAVAVTYAKCLEAKRAIDYFQKNEKIKIKKIGGLMQSKSNVSSLFKIKVSGLRRPCTGIAYIGFSCVENCTKAYYVLSNSTIQFKQAVLNFKQCKSGDLIISGLSEMVVQEELLKVLKEYLPSNIEITKLIIVRLNMPESAEEVINIETALRNLIASNPYNGIISVNKPNAKSICWNASIFYQTADNAISAFNAIKSKKNLEKCLVGMQLDLEFIICFFCPIKIFHAVKDSIDEVLSYFQTNNKSCLLNVTAVQKDENNVMIKVMTDNIQDLKNVCFSIINILQKETVICYDKSFYEVLFLPYGKEVVQNIESLSQAYIHLDYIKKSFSIFGSEKSCLKAQSILHECLKEVNVLSSVEILFSNKPKGFLKELIRQYGFDFESLRSSCNLRMVKLYIDKFILVVTGDKKAITKVQNCLDHLSRNISFPETDEKKETCPVCLGPVDEIYYRLQYCGHVYCWNCLKLQLHAMSVPFKCLSAGCHKSFVAEDIKKLLNRNDQLLLEIIYRAALKDFMCKNHEVRLCPSPNCSMLYRATFAGEQFSCPECFNCICTNCGIIYHYGMTCKEYSFQNEKKKKFVTKAGED